MHLYAAKNYSKPYAVYDWIRSKGFNVVSEIIEECPTDKEILYSKEIYWIAYYRSLQGSLTDKRTTNYILNQTDGGGGTIGFRHTVDECDRRRKQKGHWSGITGPANPLYGRKLDDEVRARMSAYQQENKKTGADHPRYGVKASPETRKKQGAQAKKRNHTRWHTNRGIVSDKCELCSPFVNKSAEGVE